MTQGRRGGLVISDRPQISVAEESGMLVITAAGISEDFSGVETKEISFPMDCAEEVARAILALIEQ